jgi:A nuclease family of the HNH/ENDO VII superfamily with conserved AHH
MPSFRKVRAVFGTQGFHCHHLMPISVVENPAFGSLFLRLRQRGFNPDDFLTNGMLLPSLEVNAVAFNLPLHRGPHPRYNKMLADFASTLEKLPVGIAIRKIREAQHILQQGLRRSGARQLEQFRSPFQTGQDFLTIERAADAMASYLEWY